MQKHGIRSIIRRKYRVQTTGSNHGHALAEDYLNREFATSRLAEKWVSDLTYIKTQEGFI
jgi:transposase InsO family protein